MSSCHVVLMRQRHMLLNLLPLRAVVDGMHLYEINKDEPLFIPVTGEDVRIFLTNGFHRSDTLQLKQEAGCSYFFKVTAVVGNGGIIAALVAAVLFFVLYAVLGHRVLLLLANMPVIALVLLFFANPRAVIVLRSWQPSPQ